jgi:hypothetical protein
MLPYLHPLKVIAGTAPPPPGTRVPLTVCKSDNITWTEQFGGAPVEACGELYQALTTLTFAPNGTDAGAQPPIRFNSSLPVVVSNCEVKPGVKLLTVRSSATNATRWAVAAVSGDRGAGLAAPLPGRQLSTRYAVAYNRTFSLSDFTLEPALLLLNPFAKPITLSGVFATVKVPGAKDVVTRLNCTGANAGGELTLPAAPLGSAAPVPVGCVGAVRLAGPAAGTISVTTVSSGGNVTSPPSPFNITRRVDQIVQPSAEERCVRVTGAFDKGPTTNDASPTTPVSTVGTMPRPYQQLCEPAKFVFEAKFGPFDNNDPLGCAHYLVSCFARAAGPARNWKMHVVVGASWQGAC